MSTLPITTLILAIAAPYAYAHGPMRADIRPVAADQYHVTWDGDPNWIYQLESSEDLVEWQLVQPRRYHGDARFEVAAHPDDIRMYYRVRALHPLDERSLDYARKTGLDGDALLRMDHFLKELEQNDIEPVWLLLGKSVFMARDGQQLRTVVGEDASVVGQIESTERGLNFKGVSGHRIEFPNPVRSHQVDEFSIWCNASASGPGIQTLVSGYGGSTQRGPTLSLGSAVGAGTPTLGAYSSGVYVSPTGSDTLNRAHPTFGLIPDQKRIYGLNFSGSFAHGDSKDRALVSVRDISSAASGASEATYFWNDGEQLSIGSRLDNFSRLDGVIDFVMICSHSLTSEQRAHLYESAAANRIFDIPVKRVLIAIGDSMTIGSIGTGFNSSRTPQLTFWQHSGWRGGYYDTHALGGRPVDVQEILYHEKTHLLDIMRSFDRYVMFWGGFNSLAPMRDDEGDRNALVERYISMGNDARARGAQSIHWSSLMGITSRPEDRLENRLLFDAYYEKRAQEENFIFYNHRLTFHANEFDGVMRENRYFADDWHLNRLGQQTIVADFIHRFPNPIPWQHAPE